jgi:hypothetical protein
MILDELIPIQQNRLENMMIERMKTKNPSFQDKIASDIHVYNFNLMQYALWNM